MPKAPEIMPLETGFDYDALPAEIRTEAKIVADEIKRRMRGAVIEVGAALARIKDRLAHGQFGEWLVAEFGMTERTAQNYMSAAALAAKYETVSVLPAGSLYLLAAPSTPEPARNAVIDRLGRGEAPSAKAIKALIADAKYQEQEEQRRRGRRTSPPSKPERPSEISNGATMTDTTGRQQSSARPPNAPSKEAQIGAMRESLAIAPTPPISQLGQAYYEARDQERDKAADELVQVFGSDLSRVSHIPIAQRVALANNCLKLLDVGIDDFRPKIGGNAAMTDPVKAVGALALPCDRPAVPEAIKEARSPPGGLDAPNAPRHRVATDPDPVQSASPLADTSLMAAYLATPAPYQAKVKDWTMRGDRLGEPAPTADDGSTLPFEALWRNARTEAHNEFRRDLLVREKARRAA